MENKQFFIKTFGCQMNLRDSEIMAQSLSRYGYVEGMDIQNADLVILNTCSIRAKAEQKVMSLLGYLRKTKEKRPHMKICVAGCVAQQEGKTIIDRMPHVDLIIGTQNIYQIGEYLLDTEQGKNRVMTNLVDQYKIPAFLPDVPGADETTTTDNTQFQFSRFVTIMQGCNNYCTYCVVPYTRGREVSRQSQDIIDEVALLVRSGVKEITLLGQNVNSYGRTNEVHSENSTYNFSSLLREVAAIEGLTRLRFTTSNPKDLTDELMSCFKDVENLCPQFHLPVQSGSDNVLKAMNRKYTVEQYLAQVEKLREYCPSIALSTDIIVGFPGETDEDFEGTMELLEKVQYHGSFSFKYSDRPGTRSSEFENKVDEEIKSKRLARFQARQDEISLERNKEFIGQEKEILVETVTEESVKGRANTNQIVHVNEAVDTKPGELLRVKINFAGQHSLKAELV
jgi:tRNA-2-methylthio-N6-dimethylallyladenosine synthase